MHTIEADTVHHIEVAATVGALVLAHDGPCWDTPVSGDALAAARKSAPVEATSGSRRLVALGHAYFRVEDRTDTHGVDYRQSVGVIVADTGARTEAYGMEADRPWFNRPERPRLDDREPAEHTGAVFFD